MQRPAFNWFTIKRYKILNSKMKLLNNKLSLEERGGRKSSIDHLDRFCCVPFLYLYAFEKHNVIARVKLHKKIINRQNKKIILGGIGDVVTIKSKRNKGIAIRLLTEGMTELKKARYDIAYLCTNIEDPLLISLYNKFGFVVLKKPYIYKRLSGKKYIENNGMIAPVCSITKYSLILQSKESLDLGKGNW